MTGEHVSAGLVMTIINVVVILGAMSWSFRRKHFKLFYYSHIILMLLLLISALVHLVWLVLLGFALWLIDIIIRYVYMAGVVITRIAPSRFVTCMVVFHPVKLANTAVSSNLLQRSLA